MPKRIQRKRTRGWRMPDGAVYVGRPSKWGNYWSVDEAPRWHPDPQQWVVDQFREWIRGGAWPLERIEELEGKDLACWCPLDQPCHADVLLELANQKEAAA